MRAASFFFNCNFEIRKIYFQKVINPRPLISFGISIPKTWQTVGETSAKIPGSIVAFLSFVTKTNGTGLRE